MKSAWQLLLAFAEWTGEDPWFVAIMFVIFLAALSAVGAALILIASKVGI